VIGHVETILAIELLVAAQALDLRISGPDGAAPGAGVAEALARIREWVSHLDGDREPGPDIAAATALIHDGALADLAGSA
jgi:histidine ammonia-lyase